MTNKIDIEQMALQAEARLIELKKVPETLLEELESGNLNHCAIKGSKAVEKCRRAMIGSLRIKMRVPESWPL
jgi:hypothetical protein